MSEEQEQVPLKICRGKDDITTFFKVRKEHFDNLLILANLEDSK